jgi:hypothetical protein
LVVVSAAPAFYPLHGHAWLWALGGSGIFLDGMERYRGGSPRTRLIHRLGRAGGAFAGALEMYGSKTQAVKSRRVNNEQAEHLCEELLRRVRSYARIGLGISGDHPRLRVTLAVPFALVVDGAPVDALKIWCYDDTHDDRGYTVLPLYVNGALAPGAPAAYCSREVQIIKDVREVPGPATARVRPYRSIVSIPLSAVENGRPLAVVNIDADVPNFFTPKNVMGRVVPMVAPVVNAIGLVLQSRNRGVPYDFAR